ncbi:MAG: glycosyltransferase [Candidatus Omnitrophota bacterium]
MPDVSIYIPCFNAAGTIYRCLEAVFKQTHRFGEVLVVDDGSSDDTVKIASCFNVRIIRHGGNKGLAAARNTALMNIDAEFVASVDSDCVAEPDWLGALMKRFILPDVYAAGGRCLEKDARTVFDLWRSAHMRQYWQDKETMPSFLFGSNVVFRRSAFKLAGLYNEGFKSNYEDVDMFMRLKAKGCRWVYAQEAVVNHIKRDTLYSLLNGYWNWNLGYYQQRGYYLGHEMFAFKIKDNIGLANRYLNEDFIGENYDLLYLDFLLALHHSLKDLEYFLPAQPHLAGCRKDMVLRQWITFLDLVFFCRLDERKDRINTVLPEAYSFSSNMISAYLILAKTISSRFESGDFRKALYRHLFFSIYGIADECLLDKIEHILEVKQGWGSLIDKPHPRILGSFLDVLFFSLDSWLGHLKSVSPDLLRLVEIACRNTDAAVC